MDCIMVGFIVVYIVLWLGLLLSSLLLVVYGEDIL